MAWRRTLCLEAELEMADDLIDNLRIFDKRDDPLPTAICRALREIPLPPQRRRSRPP